MGMAARTGERQLSTRQLLTRDSIWKLFVVPLKQLHHFLTRMMENQLKERYSAEKIRICESTLCVAPQSHSALTCKYATTKSTLSRSSFVRKSVARVMDRAMAVRERIQTFTLPLRLRMSKSRHKDSFGFQWKIFWDFRKRAGRHSSWDL